MVIILGNSCKKDTGIIGLDLHDDDSRITLHIDSSFVLKTYNILEDSLFVTKPAYALIGEFQDPLIGTSYSGYVSQISPGALSVSLADYTLDSITFNFNLARIWGAGGDVVKLGVYEITDNLTDLKTIPKSDLNINDYKNYPLHIEEKVITLNKYQRDSTNEYIVTDTVNEISITLNDYAISRLYRADSAEFSELIDSTKLFYETFKGIYLEATSVSNKNAIIGFNTSVATNGIQLHLSKPETVQTIVNGAYVYTDTVFKIKYIYNMIVGSSFNVFDHVYNEDININDSSVNDTLTYVESMNGINTVILLDDFASWKDSVDIIINSAILYLNYNKLTYTYNSLTPATTYFIWDYSLDSTLMTDYIQNGLPQLYNKDKGQLEIKLTQHLQNYIFGKTRSLSIRIQSATDESSANKTTIYGSAHEKKPKLIITYSKP